MNSSDTGDALSDYPVQVIQPVVWGDMDAFQHVNNTVYFRYFEDIRIEFMQQTGMFEVLENQQIGPILASTSCDFRAPLNYPDTIHIGTRVVDLQERKFSMAYRVVSEKLERVVAKGSGLIVYYDYKVGKSCPIPAQIVTAIERLAERSM